MEKLRVSVFKKYEIKHEGNDLMENRRPDFVFLLKDKPNLIYAPFVVELQVGPFDKKHKAQVIRYNLSILDINTRRQSITSVLTNLEQIMFVQSNRAKNDHGFDHILSVPMNFWEPPWGLRYIQQMLDDPTKCGYDESLNFCIRIES
jgi:hypothetical protein